MTNTNDQMNGPDTREDEIAALLPFYLNGGLDAGDTARVEDWLATSEKAEAALANVESERAAAVSVNEVITPPLGGLAKLMDAIEKEPVTAHRAATGGLATLLKGIVGWLNQTPASLAWAACAALLMVATVQGVWLARDTGGYEVASGGGQQQIQGPTALIGFQSDATVGTISEVLRDAGASIVSGPRGGGVYVIRLEEREGLAPPSERIAALAARREIVRFANLSKKGAE